MATDFNVIQLMPLLLLPIGCIILHVRVRHIASLLLCCSVILSLFWSLWGSRLLSKSIYDTMVSTGRMEWQTHDLVMSSTDWLLTVFVGGMLVWTAFRVEARSNARA